MGIPPKGFFESRKPTIYTVSQNRIRTIKNQKILGTVWKIGSRHIKTNEDGYRHIKTDKDGYRHIKIDKDR